MRSIRKRRVQIKARTRKCKEIISPTLRITTKGISRTIITSFKIPITKRIRATIKIMEITSNSSNNMMIDKGARKPIIKGISSTINHQTIIDSIPNTNNKIIIIIIMVNRTEIIKITGQIITRIIKETKLMDRNNKLTNLREFKLLMGNRRSKIMGQVSNRIQKRRKL